MGKGGKRKENKETEGREYMKMTLRNYIGKGYIVRIHRQIPGILVI